MSAHAVEKNPTTTGPMMYPPIVRVVIAEPNGCVVKYRIPNGIIDATPARHCTPKGANMCAPGSYATSVWRIGFGVFATR